MKLYEIIQQLRLQKGLSEEELAKKIQMDENTYSQFENGNFQMSADTFFKMFPLLDIPIDIEGLLKSYIKSNHNEPNDVYSTYLRDIEKYPLMSDKEIIELFQTKVDEEIRKKIAQSCLRYVVDIAKEMNVIEMDFMDVINEGNIGLMKSIDDFQSTVHASFINYMTRRVKDSICRAVVEQQHMRMESIKRNFVSFQPAQIRLRKQIKQLTEELGREPSILEISERTGIEADALENFFSIIKNPISMEVEDEKNK